MDSEQSHFPDSWWYNQHILDARFKDKLLSNWHKKQCITRPKLRYTQLNTRQDQSVQTVHEPGILAAKNVRMQINVHYFTVEDIGWGLRLSLKFRCNPKEMKSYCKRILYSQVPSRALNTTGIIPTKPIFPRSAVALTTRAFIFTVTNCANKICEIKDTSHIKILEWNKDVVLY